MSYLLDSNVLSEWWKPNPDETVVQWIESAEWYLPVPVIAEIQEGAEAAPGNQRRIQINLKLDVFLRDYGDLVIPWNTEIARTWGRLKQSPEVKRQPQSLWDSLIDAMAVHHGATIATRNVSDFRHAKTFNPWKSK